jgi:hypothetical protein
MKGPVSIGLNTAVCGELDPKNVSVIGVERPPPLGVSVIVPVTGLSGVTTARTFWPT